MPIITTIEKGLVPVHVWTDEIEHSAFQQLENISRLPIIHHHVAAMPDVHFGIGATVGSVIPTIGAIIPSAVGVDIGCGMNAVRLSLTANDLPESLARVRSAIEEAVPVGPEMHDNIADKAAVKRLSPGFYRIIEIAPDVDRRMKNSLKAFHNAIGTLGGGNHFIELCLDEDDRVWVMLHSGSRGIGNKIGEHFIHLARKEMERLQAHLPNKDLAYLREGTQSYDDYCFAVGWAQEYAWTNRQVMLQLILEALKKTLPSFTVTSEAVNCHHNYVNDEVHFGAKVHVTRKGAISAREGELGIIPGSMGTRSYIVRGKGNADSFCSCSHGAGRRMSRGEASRRYTVEDLKAQTEGVECRKDRGVIDEIPGAYKSIDRVMAFQSDLVEVVHTLRQVVCVKG